MLITVLLIAVTCAVSITCFSNASLLERLLLWPALSGAAILLERATASAAEPPVALYTEDEEEGEDGLLR